MKRYLLILMAAVCCVAAWADAPVKREQRGVWMSAYVSDWPSSAITTSNAATMRKACCKMLDTLRANNMNAVYYHVRAMCDAMYESAYEPWSSYVSGTRGVAPAFDPLAFILEEAHKRGIELYAWVNPYRYGHGSNTWGQSDRDYIYTHPDWLLVTDYESVLNPGIPEVRQRVVDVCRDIITKYDVDGLVFDDYFYNQGGSSFNLDSALYNAYVAAGGTLEQGDWRRENVNQMVKDVNDMVKATKPWVRFGIGPAGVACSSASVAAKYGVEPSPGSDWQYNQIYSDPMAWLTRGTVDFLAPQVYWNTSGTYTPVTTWWGKMGDRFNRHLYISHYAVDGAKDNWEVWEYLKQVRVMREAMTSGIYGSVYFKYATWRQLSTTIDGRARSLRAYLRDSVYNTVSLNPAVAWLKPDQSYNVVTNLAQADGALSWDSIPNVRYVVYGIPDSVPDSAFNCQPQYIMDVSYACHYTIPTAYSSGYRYAVTILDRWENEYAPVLVGATAKQAQVPTLLWPDNGATVIPLTFLRWTDIADNYTVEVYADQAMDSLVALVATDSASLPLTAVPGVDLGTYYWRVVARGLNEWDAVSELRSFTVEAMRITAPADGATGVSLTPTITWTAGGEGVSYRLEVSTTSTFNSNIIDVALDSASYAVPQYILAGATTYYARVTATQGSATATTDVSSFTTIEVIPAAPQFIYPTEADTVLYGHEQLTFVPEAGIGSLRIEISASTSFPVRSSYRGTITDGSFASPQLSTLTGTGRMVDGKTYYARARYAYLTLATGSTIQYTAYSDIRTFVYHDTLVGDVNLDGKVDAGDIACIVNIITGKNPAGTYGTRDDVNGDGSVNSGDLGALVSLITE